MKIQKFKVTKTFYYVTTVAIITASRNNTFDQHETGKTITLDVIYFMNEIINVSLF